jgi:hypothetical protein
MSRSQIFCTLLHFDQIEEGAALITLCAWCEQEGRPAVLYKTRDDSSTGWELYSHGICTAHRDQLLAEMQTPFAHPIRSALPSAIERSSMSQQQLTPIHRRFQEKGPHDIPPAAAHLVSEPLDIKNSFKTLE